MVSLRVICFSFNICYNSLDGYTLFINNSICFIIVNNSFVDQILDNPTRYRIDHTTLLNFWGPVLFRADHEIEHGECNVALALLFNYNLYIDTLKVCFHYYQLFYRINLNFFKNTAWRATRFHWIGTSNVPVSF